ncbi:PH domain-containing protein (plasmid) [Apilactobacillus apisilvae]|uniref:PH domain-containing protein n=1 Tax=Apilactobacillus apisilvae TaxID=2923364 RepID=A0ABY4PIZ7_9LACO|nr:PH domain-containing protein [Apilactobacillus apisilvae]UQS85805.1 PH domain-containing protein [Apilactobacillus apisilvae]
MNINKLNDLIDKSDNPNKMKKIINQLNDAGFNDSYMTGREIKALPDIIDDDETIKYAVSGFLEGDNDSVLVVVTDKRVIFENKKILFGSSNTEIPLNMVNNVSYNSGMLMAKLMVTSGTKTYTISQVPKKSVHDVAETIRTETENAKHKKQNSEKPKNNSNDGINDLRKLKQLVDENVITQEDFEAKKKQILGI